MKRVVVLGDSMTVCAGTSYESIATTQLESLLSAACKPTNVEVYNLACGGHSILHHVATLHEVALTYKPDLVLVFLFPENDFDSQSYEDDRRYALEHIKSGESAPVPEVVQAWYKSFYCYRVLAPRLSPLIGNYLTPKGQHAPTFIDKTVAFLSDHTDPWSVNVTALKDIADTTKRAGIPCVAILLPGNWGTYELQRRLHKCAADVCADAGLPANSLIDAFVATGRAPGSFAVSMIDNHPNAAYGPVVANAVVGLLKSTGHLDALRMAGS